MYWNYNNFKEHYVHEPSRKFIVIKKVKNLGGELISQQNNNICARHTWVKSLNYIHALSSGISVQLGDSSKVWL